MKMCGLLEKNQAGENSERIPFSFFKDVLSAAYGSSGGAAQAVQTHSPAQTKPFSKFFSDIEISVKKDCLFVKKHKKIHTDLVFFDIIEEKGSYDFPFGRLFVQADGQIIINDFATDLKCRFPFCVRNFCPGDEVLNAEGKMKSIADVFAGWKIPERERALVPLIQALNAEGEIKALLAGFLGY